MQIKKDILPEGHRNRPGYPMQPKGLLYHTTNNWTDGAGDEAHAEYMENTTRVVSWHETVDKDSATQHLPYDENGWHAGDGGRGHYNRNWLGMEIAAEAVDRGEPLDEATYKNAVERAAYFCEKFNFGWDQLQPHKIVYGKDCPHHTLFNHDQFKRDVFDYINKKDEQKQTPDDPYLYVVQKGDTLTKIAEIYDKSVDYLARLNDLSDPNKIYVGQRLKTSGKAPEKEDKPKEPVKPYYVGKRVEAIVAKVNFYDGPRWNNPTGYFTKGQGWEIVDLIQTKGSDGKQYPQYKVKNSKGHIYYITARKDLVEIV